MTEFSALSGPARRRAWLERVDSTMRSQGVEPAGRVALQALEAGVEDAAVLNLAALARYGEGRYDDASQLLKRARALAPRDPHILNTLGVCLQALGQQEEALDAYKAAIRTEPAMAAAHFNRGTLLQEMNDLKAARACFDKAAALDPDYVEPLASLAWLDAQAGNTQSARERGERARALRPESVLARLAIASADLQDGKLAEAGAILLALHRDPSLSPVNRSIVLGLTGDLYDAGGRPAEAFESYRSSNALLKELNAPIFDAAGRESALAQVQRLTGWFDETDPDRWTQSPPLRSKAADPRAHVFLVGFPRSGTTLMENVLAAHPDIVSLEEADCLERVATPYLTSADGLERLAVIGGGEAHRQRETYWARVRALGVEPRGKVFIDKMPLATVQLPVIAKLFPTARILFARRDPRDVVLSCFRRRFGLNPSMYELLTLDGAAAFYDAVMRLAGIYASLLPLPQHVVRYESLVEDLEGRARSALEFVGLDWDPRLLDFAAKAKSRGITTPSAAQVARGLNREGQGVWRRYVSQMSPVLPLLQPWVERFDYQPE